MSFYPNRNVLRFHDGHAVLAHRNESTGETVTSRNTSNTVLDFDRGTETHTGVGFKLRDAEGRIIFQHAGRIVFDETGNVIFEAGQHPEFEPDFITFICAELS